MALLNEQDAKTVREHFEKNLVDPVTLLFFTQTIACQFCRETQQVLEELADLSDRITLDVYNFVGDKETADQYAIDKIPATVVMGARDYGVRFYGIPSGYEFTSLVEAVVAVVDCVGRVVSVVLSRGGDVLLTSDHWNAEQM